VLINNMHQFRSTILQMEWLLEVHFCFMDLLVDGLELFFCLHMSFLKRYEFSFFLTNVFSFPTILFL
jgi:hypothetical protein